MRKLLPPPPLSARPPRSPRSRPTLPPPHPVEEIAHAGPLGVGEGAAHVDEEHQLALEEAAAGVVEAGGDALDVLAVQRGGLELAPERDRLLLDLAPEV